MACLARKLYDPAVAVTKATNAALAMTALDTTNLRNTFVVPANGLVLVRMQCAIHGATTSPQILLGVMNGASVVGRQAPKQNVANIAATSLIVAEAAFIVGLTPGATVSLDAAYGVETAVAATGIKYGGPNDTTVNNAFGGFLFEVWKA
jgi:hypothetical protein